MWILLNYVDLVHASCDSGCSVVKASILSWPMALLGIAITSTLLWTAATKHDATFNTVSRIGGVGAVFLVGLLVSWKAACIWCLVVDFGLICLALTTLGKVGVATSTIPLLICLWAAQVSVATAQPPRIVRFTARPYERLLDRSRFARYLVVFSDPECPHCKALHTELARLNNPNLHVMYRWALLPETATQSEHAVVAIETLGRDRPEVASMFRDLLFEEQQALSDAVLARLARKVGAETEVKGAIEHPDETALQLVAEDGALMPTLQVSSVPAMFEVQISPTEITYMNISLEQLKDSLKGDAQLGGGAQ